MEVLRPILLLCFFVVGGCERAPTVCEGEHVRVGVARGFALETEPAYALFKNLQLKEIKAVKEDESTGVTDCVARLIIPTEQGPMDSPVTYRVGPAASDGHSVFMYFIFDDALEKFFNMVQAVAGRTLGKSG